MNAELPGRQEELLYRLQEQAAQIRAAQERAAQVTAWAPSPDGLIGVRVGAQGQLLAVRLDPGAYDRLPAPKLAGLILELARTAAADAARQVRDILTPVLPAGGDLGVPPTLAMLGEAGLGSL